MKFAKLLLLALVLCPSTVFAEEAGRIVKGSFSNRAGDRSYQLYIPSRKKEKMPLFVVLHGCFQSGEQLATGTYLNELAEQQKFYVLYPEQTYSDNAWKCWNWFKAENQTRDSGEASIVAGMTRKILQEYGVDKSQVFVAGLSAGAAFASDLIGCYSDLFAGVMVHSGMEYAAAKTEEEGHNVAKNGSSTDLSVTAQAAYDCSPKRTQAIPVLVVHGTVDPYVNPLNGDRAITQFLKLNLLIQPQAEVSQRVSHTEPADQMFFPASVTDLMLNGTVVLRKVSVEGMGHGWSGGRPTAPYMEPRGVDASRMMVDFFLKNTRR